MKIKIKLKPHSEETVRLIAEELFKAYTVLPISTKIRVKQSEYGNIIFVFSYGALYYSSAIYGSSSNEKLKSFIDEKVGDFIKLVKPLL